MVLLLGLAAGSSKDDRSKLARWSKMSSGSVEPDATAVRAKRLERGLTQEQLAKKVGCTKRTIENVERGNPARINTLADIATALGIEVKELIKSDSQETPTSIIKATRLGTAPACPALLIGRDEDLAVISSKLEAAVSSTTQDRKLVIVRGWPGVGKTTIARAIAHSKQTVDQFPDGVLWVSLGKQPSLELELLTWGRALGATSIGPGADSTRMSGIIAGLLIDRQVLLIVDDVWDAQHASPFLVGGRLSATLITTRITSVAEALSPSPDDIHHLEILSDDDGLQLLETLAPAVVARNRKQCRELVKELEGLPLALQVAGRLLRVEDRNGWSAAHLLKELRADASRILKSKAPADMATSDNTSPTISALLQKSTDHLDSETRQRFAYLAPFAPRPATFDLEALKAVWRTSKEDTRQTIDVLIDRGLLEPLGEGDYQIHQILVDHARTMLEHEQEEGDDKNS